MTGHDLSELINWYKRQKKYVFSKGLIMKYEERGVGIKWSGLRVCGSP